ncbi:hypothetical protein F5890DRAFT_1557825 [Lentinula detonsa]|uniref:Uncharacterized protein n=1 Tax=Lentinula detonsa TaxID=2804962 RepID=A0AA38PS67_9AGAR|nr:hypothetical protein F5890DRAFT_1557825 [Lentinula detonsa]
MIIDQPQPQPSSTSTPRGSGMAMLLNLIHSGDEGERERTLSARPSPAPQQNPNFRHQSTSVPKLYFSSSASSSAAYIHIEITGAQKAATIERTPTPLPNFHVSSLFDSEFASTSRCTQACGQNNFGRRVWGLYGGIGQSGIEMRWSFNSGLLHGTMLPSEQTILRLRGGTNGTASIGSHTTTRKRDQRRAENNEQTRQNYNLRDRAWRDNQ